MIGHQAQQLEKLVATNSTKSNQKKQDLLLLQVERVELEKVQLALI
jgi:hypothetical protein